MKICINNSRQGTILMETVLSTALFVVLIGGTCWIGDLIHAKCKLVSADRYAAWNAGNRHMTSKDRIAADIQEHLFPVAAVGNQGVEVAFEKGPSEGWSGYYGATVNLDWEMPIWTEGWLKGGALIGKTANVPNRSFFMGRDAVEEMGPSHSALLMRTPFSDVAYRTWDPRPLADTDHLPWDQDVYQEVWPVIGDLAGTSPGDLAYVPPEPPEPPGYEHERHDAYVDWSE